MSESYVHGYDSTEAQRLQDQAASLADLLHADAACPPGHRVLEAACGVGAQTVTLARRSPQARIVSVDVAAPSLAQARAAVRAAAQAGFGDVRVSPRVVYVDDSRPHLAEGFTRRTFTAMVRGVRAAAIAAELATPEGFDRGIAGLERTAAGGGVFWYTFFKAVAAGNGDRR